VSETVLPSDPKRDHCQGQGLGLNPTDPPTRFRNLELASVIKLKTDLEAVPAVPIEQAAELLDISVRTLYRRRSEFEHKRSKRHLYFTLRSIKQHIEIEHYNPTSSFDLTISDVFDISDNVPSHNRIRRG
jgi:hypothetical protein